MDGLVLLLRLLGISIKLAELLAGLLRVGPENRLELLVLVIHAVFSLVFL